MSLLEEQLLKVQLHAMEEINYFMDFITDQNSYSMKTSTVARTR